MKYYNCCGEILLKPKASGSPVGFKIGGMHATLLIDIEGYNLSPGVLFGETLTLYISRNGTVKVNGVVVTNGIYKLQWIGYWKIIA